MIKERKINNNRLECLDERDQPERELKGARAAGRRSEIGKWRDAVSLGALLEQKAFISWRKWGE